jgi:hypothetical protein
MVSPRRKGEINQSNRKSPRKLPPSLRKIIVGCLPEIKKMV